MRWMTCMAACDKEHLFFEQARRRFLGDPAMLRHISIIYGETKTFIWCECTAESDTEGTFLPSVTRLYESCAS